MEQNQVNSKSQPNEDDVVEALTLTCEMDMYGTTYYLNKEGQVHRIHGPAVIYEDGGEDWCKNDLLHREDGPASIYKDGTKFYYVNGVQLSKRKFIKWQKDHGIKTIE